MLFGLTFATDDVVGNVGRLKVLGYVTWTGP